MFEILSKHTGLNFVFDKDVKTDQRTTVMLKNSTVESAIYFLLLTNQLEQQVNEQREVIGTDVAWAFQKHARPPPTRPTLNVVFGEPGTCRSPIAAIARPIA